MFNINTFTPQIYFGVYGSPLSYYGNSVYGVARPYQQTYGGWPDEHPNIQDLPAPYQEQEDTETDIKAEITQPIYDEAIYQNIEIIRRLRAELQATEDIEIRSQIRKQIEVARKAKDRAFKLRAMVDEEEAAFILLH